MKVPFICNHCENEESHEISPLTRKCGCGGTMTIFYQDNYEKVVEENACHTCVRNTEGGGEYCNYCNQI